MDYKSLPVPETKGYKPHRMPLFIGEKMVEGRSLPEPPQIVLLTSSGVTISCRDKTSQVVSQASESKNSPVQLARLCFTSTSKDVAVLSLPLIELHLLLKASHHTA